MMNIRREGSSKTLSVCFGVAVVALVSASVGASAVQAGGNQTSSKGVAVAYPWVFDNGTETSRKTAVTTAEEIVRKAGFASIPGDVAKATWITSKLPEPSYREMPSKDSLEAFGSALHAQKVIYGSVSWHTRSIWVDAGPKTISTATVDVYVFDVETAKVVFKKTSVVGRSDEKLNVYKTAADVLITPLVTAVSGGPATPQEQRAVQIALGLAYHDWAKSGQ